VATVFTTSLPNLVRLVWCRHTKCQIGVAAAIPAIPLPAPLWMCVYVSRWLMCKTTVTN